MGILHVLTGPDHLSALATLSANTYNLEAFWYGVRWGIGHSFGLILVGSVLIMLDSLNRKNDNDDDPIGISEYFQNVCESLVGVFMIALGIYGLRSAFVKHRLERESEGETNNLSDEENRNGDLLSSLIKSDHGHASNALELSPNLDSPLDSTACDVYNGEASMSLAYVSYDAMGTTIRPTRKRETNVSDYIHNHHHHHDCCGDGDEDCCNCCPNLNIPKPLLSLGIGIIHGVAGPGGVLGVLPAVQLHNLALASIYLFTFCVVSTLTMGTYAALYGTFSSYISTGRETVTPFRVEIFSSGLSVFVGAMWLFLLSIGKLNDIFP